MDKLESMELKINTLEECIVSGRAELDKIIPTEVLHNTLNLIRKYKKFRNEYKTTWNMAIIAMSEYTYQKHKDVATIINDARNKMQHTYEQTQVVLDSLTKQIVIIDAFLKENELKTLAN